MWRRCLTDVDRVGLPDPRPSTGEISSLKESSGDVWSTFEHSPGGGVVGDHAGAMNATESGLSAIRRQVPPQATEPIRT
jgi:hypothetical protein